MKVDYKKKALKVMDDHKWKSSDIEDEDGVWFGTDNIDINIFLTDEEGYKYGIDVFDCELDNEGYIVTKKYVLTFYK